MAGTNRRDRLYQAVREVLFREWDPIRGSDEPLCQDESDSYAPTVCRMLAAGAHEAKLAAQGGRLRTDAMGLPDGDEHRGHDRSIARWLTGLAG